MSGSALAGGAALSTSAVAYVAALAALRRADHGPRVAGLADTTWWFGYARDSANMGGFLAFSGSFWVLGLPGPLAFLAGAAFTLAIYGVDYLGARRLGARRAAWMTGGVALVGCAVAAALREALARGLHVLVESLF